MRIRHSRHQHTAARPCINPHAAGLDIGSEEIWACVPEDRDAEPVRSFGTFTPDLYALAGWLAACQIETVAMESTGCIGLDFGHFSRSRRSEKTAVQEGFDL